jgi:isoquinoline 1-oxidoreductase alpha subunit
VSLIRRVYEAVSFEQQFRTVDARQQVYDHRFTTTDLGSDESMSKYKLEINGEKTDVDASPEMPLLWVLRDKLKLTGTKFGCGIAQCGACTVHINGVAMRSCVLPVSAVSGPVTTIEGLAGNDGLHPLQSAWIEHDVPQCGYCQAGQIMSAAALLSTNSQPNDDEIDKAMAGNYCRCGTYIRVRKAIHSAALFYNADTSADQGLVEGVGE